MKNTVSAGRAPVLCGIDNILDVSPLISGAAVGLVTNMTGVTREMTLSSDAVARIADVKYLFSPEHGLRGERQAGEGDSVYKDKSTGAEIIPLYGGRTAPDAETLSKLDFLLFDIQDAGARYYTYLSTLTDCMKACADTKTPMIVFDRPNPISLSRIEGNILDERFSSFVGRYAVPTRYGLTIGEYARYIGGSRDIGCDLRVVPCSGLTREMYYDDTGLCFINPSPNINSVECAVNYIATCLFEGTNISEGRGTTTPFCVAGAPFVDPDALASAMDAYDLPGVVIRPAYFTPVCSKYAGESCGGVQLHVTDRDAYRPFETGLRLFDTMRSLFPEMTVRNGIDLLFGSDRLRTELIGKEKIGEFLKSNSEPLAKWAEEAERYRIYRSSAN